MKKGQVEVRQILLLFELILVALMIGYFYKSAHDTSPLTYPELDASLTLLTLKTAPPHLQNPYLTNRIPHALRQQGGLS